MQWQGRCSVPADVMSTRGRPPRLLKRLLAQSTRTPNAQRQGTKQPDLPDLDSEQCKKRKLDFIHDAHEALSSDDFSSIVNVCECHCDETGEQLLIVTTKAVHYHEPAKYLSHLKLVVTGSSNYYIQVRIRVNPQNST